MVKKDESSIAFIEEQENLYAMERMIDYIISQYDKPLKKAEDEVEQYSFVLNREDLENKQYYLGRKYKVVDKIEKYEVYRDSPYFGRFDLKVGDSENTYFIGENKLSYDEADLIIGWKDPLAKVYYNKTDHTFNLFGEKHDLLLRRAIDIRRGKLIAVNTEYDALDLSLDNEIVDPFLISILKDKRRDYKLTNIIKTIQSNQYNIISRPLDENFIVQGCAGSGKTMILLHRLSFIAFNYPDVSFSRFCILTPHEAFNLHVDELSKELGLDKIKRYTVESFYATLIASRSYADNVASSEAGKLVQKLPASAEGLISEEMLNNDLLNYLYSEELYNRFIEAYRVNNEDATDKINSSKVRDILKKYGKKVDVIKEMNYKSFASYNSALNDVITKYDAAYDKANKQKHALDEQGKRVGMISKEIEDAEAVLNQLKENIIKVCDDYVRNTREEKASLEIIVGSFNEKLEPITAERDAARKEIKEKESLLRANNNDLEIVTTYDHLSTHNDKISELIKELYSDEYSQLEKLYSRINSSAFYNFGRKARAQAEASEIEKNLSEKVPEIISVFEEDEKKYLKELINKEAELCGVITEIKNEREKSAIKLSRFEKEFERIKSCKSIIESGELPNISVHNELFYSDITEKPARKYNAVFNSYKEKEKQLETQNRIFVSEKNKYDSLLADVISDEEIEIIKEAKNIVEDYNMKKLHAGLDGMLKSIYDDYGEKYSSKANYRHKLYLKLLLCMLYYGPANNMGYYISIDEAQDLAKTEYKVLRQMLGDKTVFNLYGDVNQLIYDYKGIADWEELSDEIQHELYLLNENYRNTLEITAFCNDEFQAGITAIGLSGKRILKPEFKKALNKLEELHKDNPKYRCAIIYKKGFGDISEKINKYLHSSHAFSVQNNDQISVLSVEKAKGLEFDAVVVIQNDMTANEKYISYTRALDNLIITNY